jgi:mannose-6-phosphate isomerase-like protein (cupin superfamily)
VRIIHGRSGSGRRWLIPRSLRSGARARLLGCARLTTQGCDGSLRDGPVVEIHGVEARLIAWPGNGFQTEAIHVVTVRPGQQTDQYAYAVAEEAMLCIAGRGEVWLRGAWREIAPGDRQTTFKRLRPEECPGVADLR